MNKLTLNEPEVPHKTLSHAVVGVLKIVALRNKVPFICNFLNPNQQHNSIT